VVALAAGRYQMQSSPKRRCWADTYASVWKTACSRKRGVADSNAQQVTRIARILAELAWSGYAAEARVILSLKGKDNVEL